MKKKIKDLTIKEFYKMMTDNIEEMKEFTLGKDPLDYLQDISIEQYLKENGDREVDYE